MRYFLALLLMPLLGIPNALAWNAAGHRLVALIAWEQLSPASREFVAGELARHPDHARWVARAGGRGDAAIFVEASTWPDDIRNDPRFFDETRDPPTGQLPGYPDMARHKHWHYVDLDRHGQAVEGEIDTEIRRLARLSRSTSKNGQISYDLPWLLHLVADLHQPLHVGYHEDDGGNTVTVENPFNPRVPFPNLHQYWDDLPGPPWLRGTRLEKKAQRLLSEYPPPQPGNVATWRAESHALLTRAYPTESGSLLPIVSDSFHREASKIAERRIVDAGYRLGWLLETEITARVSRGTP